ncbi:MAG: ATPase [Candidatus Omnitrophica bacterium]|nr:ATPase [Candidatus Omnitrophota bacterium]
MTIPKRILRMHPATIVLLSFLLTILVGALLLKLPISSTSEPLSWLDSLFTATSAVCVTGLIVVDTGEAFTFFGQCVILFLIQVGGLGVMTISVALFRWFGRTLSIHQHVVMQNLFTHTPRKDIYHLLRSILFFTLGFEAVGAVLLTLHWSGEFPFFKALWFGIFHSVSAFCNAGFALFPDSLMRYDLNLLLNLTVCGLIVAGGIGFPVLYEFQSLIFARSKKRVRLSLQTKTVLLTTAFMILAGAGMYAYLERFTLPTNEPLSHWILIPFFQSITCRTAGFNTVDFTKLHEATVGMMIFLMFIGASPGSCGGGVKTTTFALLTAFTINRIQRSRRVNMFKKSIPTETVTRSVSLVLLSIGIIAVVVFMLLLGDPSNTIEADGAHATFLEYLFETVSAFGTVGLSLGITPHLPNWDKGWIILTMIVGRVGVLTFSYIVVGSGTTNGVEYSEENLMIG